MALVSRHYNIMQAILASIIADVDIVAAIAANRWQIQKKPWSRNKKWVEGALIAPLTRQKPDYENQNLKIICPTVVSLIWPTDGGLTTNQASEMAVMERVEQIFDQKGKTKLPVPMRNLDTLYSNRDKFVLERLYVTPGDQFVDSAIQAGFDAMACVVTCEILANPTDESTLGA